eukprot:3154077-Prymnesium_polylepis.1
MITFAPAALISSTASRASASVGLSGMVDRATVAPLSTVATVSPYLAASVGPLAHCDFVNVADAWTNPTRKLDLQPPVPV